ncbi:MAG: EamA family transporter [Oscillospiraceae bacterium]|nr:EamA family transporter [Oscillospiraceae bacterium]
MTQLTKYALLMILSSLISAFSQVLLKIAAGRTYRHKWQEYLNPPVLLAYTIFFLCTFLTMYALKVVPLSMAPLLEATGYIFVTVLSYLFFREIPGKKHLLGLFLILGGIVVYAV